MGRRILGPEPSLAERRGCSVPHHGVSRGAMSTSQRENKRTAPFSLPLDECHGVLSPFFVVVLSFRYIVLHAEYDVGDEACRAARPT